jgi:hypothetical protein
MIRARFTRTRSCSACRTRLPETDVRAKRTDLCNRCYARAIRVLLRPCRN